MRNWIVFWLMVVGLLVLAGMDRSHGASLKHKPQHHHRAHLVKHPRALAVQVVIPKAALMPRPPARHGKRAKHR